VIRIAGAEKHLPLQNKIVLKIFPERDKKDPIVAG
jgi:hypothetical protein